MLTALITETTPVAPSRPDPRKDGPGAEFSRVLAGLRDRGAARDWQTPPDGDSGSTTGADGSDPADGGDSVEAGQPPGGAEGAITPEVAAMPDQPSAGGGSLSMPETADAEGWPPSADDPAPDPGAMTPLPALRQAAPPQPAPDARGGTETSPVKGSLQQSVVEARWATPGGNRPKAAPPSAEIAGTAQFSDPPIHLARPGEPTLRPVMAAPPPESAALAPPANPTMPATPAPARPEPLATRSRDVQPATPGPAASTADTDPPIPPQPVAAPARTPSAPGPDQPFHPRPAPVQTFWLRPGPGGTKARVDPDPARAAGVPAAVDIPAPARIGSGPAWPNGAAPSAGAAPDSGSPSVSHAAGGPTPASPAAESPLSDTGESRHPRPDTGTDPAPFSSPRTEHARTDAPRFELPRAEPPRSETAAQIARQIAEAVTRADAPSFDLALDPEELGPVRMRLHLHEGVSLLTIHADRPETLDLMRRHIATLEQDLRAQGHDSLSLRFSGGSPQGDGQARDQGKPPASSVTRDVPHAPSLAERGPSAARARQSDHLDLRL